MDEFNTIMKEIYDRLNTLKHEADAYLPCVHCEKTQCCGGSYDPHIHEEDGADISGWHDLLNRLEALFRKKYRLPPKD